MNPGWGVSCGLSLRPDFGGGFQVIRENSLIIIILGRTRVSKNLAKKTKVMELSEVIRERVTQETEWAMSKGDI